MNVKNQPASDRDRFDQFVRSEGLKHLKHWLDDSLGRPVWLVFPKLGAPAKNLQAGLQMSSEIWEDPRTPAAKRAAHLFPVLRRAWRASKPFAMGTGSKAVYALPLVPPGSARSFGVLVLERPASNFSRRTQLLLDGVSALLVENACKSEELARLSATIKPRAIALSTVHTVHRIINSTLNLNELVSRLAHLAAQVLRVQRCLIYMVEKIPAPPALPGRPRPAPRARLVIKAAIGYPKHRQPAAAMPVGAGLEGRIARTAETMVRKSFITLPLIDEDVVGVVTISRKKDGSAFNTFDLEILNTLAEEAVIAIKNAQMYEDQRRVTLSTIRSIATILGARAPQTSRIPPETFLKIALSLAEELKLSDEETQALHYATILKDTAKIGIPDEILKKPSKLTGEELNKLRAHPIQGARIVQSFESLKNVAPIIQYSREKFDGTGYPEGLKGDKIPIGARILSVLSAFEAITIGRPYRGQSSIDEALQEIARNRGTQFDPRVVDAFIRVVQKQGVDLAPPRGGA